MSDKHTFTPLIPEKGKVSVSPREIVIRYLPYLPWVLASTLLALLAGGDLLLLKFNLPVDDRARAGGGICCGTVRLSGLKIGRHDFPSVTGK